jgi:hypothetical protein
LENEDLRHKDEKLFILILNCVKEPNFYRKLQLAYLLTFNISPDLALKYDAEQFQKDIKELLLDEPFVRGINRRQSIILEDGNVYFGEEHLACPYNYELELETTILNVEVNLTEFLAQITNALDIPINLDLGSIGEKK